MAELTLPVEQIVLTVPPPEGKASQFNETNPSGVRQSRASPRAVTAQSGGQNVTCCIDVAVVDATTRRAGPLTNGERQFF